MKYRTPWSPEWTHARWLMGRQMDTIAYGDVYGKVNGTYQVQHWSVTFARIGGMVTPLMRVDGRDCPVGTYPCMHDALAFTWAALATATGKEV